MSPGIISFNNSYEDLMLLLSRLDGMQIIFFIIGFVIWLFYYHGSTKENKDIYNYYWNMISLYLLVLIMYANPETINEFGVTSCILVIVSSSFPLVILAMVTNAIVPQSFFIALYLFMLIVSIRLGIKTDSFKADKKILNGILYGTPTLTIMFYVIKNVLF